MNTIAVLIIIVSIFLLIRARNKKKDTIKDTVKETSTEDSLAPENYRYTGRVPKDFEDIIISFKIKGATSGSTEDGISIINQLLYYKDKALAYRGNNGRIYINTEDMEGYGNHIFFCLIRDYESSEDYTKFRSEKELLDFVFHDTN